MPDRKHQRQRTIARIAGCPMSANVSEVVARTGLSRRTLRRYLTDPDASAQIDALRQQQPDPGPPQTDDDLLRAAIAGLWELANDASAAAGVRERAWRGVADIAHRRMERREDEELEAINAELRKRGLLT